MPIRTVEQYKDSLKDDRVVYLRGQRVTEVTEHPLIQKAIDHEATDYRLMHDPEYRDLAVVRHPDSGEEMSRYFLPPSNAEELLKRSELIETACREGGTLVVLAKVVGSDALFGLTRTCQKVDAALGTSYSENVKAFYESCWKNDVSFALAQTDVKGDRSLRPSEQEDPDLYLHIVEERPDGIVVRGAKTHTSNTTHANEMIVLPTRAMGEADKDYAVSFAIPLNTPGLKLLMSGYGSYTERNEFDHPVSSGLKMTETLTVFDDVFVPNERIFLKGEWQFAGPLALSFVEYHRLTAISYKLPFLDLLAGAGAADGRVQRSRKGRPHQRETVLAGQLCRNDPLADPYGVYESRADRLWYGYSQPGNREYRQTPFCGQLPSGPVACPGHCRRYSGHRAVRRRSAQRRDRPAD